MTKRRFRYSKELDRKKVMEKWREALQSAPSLISSIFEYGGLKAMARHDLVARLHAKNVNFDDVDDVMHEAERKRLICTDYRMWSAYYWIPLEKGEEEKRKTEELEKTVEDVFLESNAEWLFEEKLKEELLNKGPSTEDIERAIYETERKCVISHPFVSGGGREFQLIPHEDRERKLELRRLQEIEVMKRCKKHIYTRP